MLKRLIAIIALVSLLSELHGQSSNTPQTDSLIQVPSSYLSQVSSRAGKVEQKLNKKNDRAIRQMVKLETRMKRKLEVMDSGKAKQVFGDIEGKYKELEQRLHGRLSGPYIPSMDSMLTTVKFLQQNPQLLERKNEIDNKVKETLSKVNGLDDKLREAETIKAFIKEREQFLKEQLSSFGFARQLKILNKQAYYYSAQVNEYKELLKDHKKAERKAIELLSNTQLFKDFMRKNSMLASLFRLPGDPNDPLAQANLAGLQTRTQVNNIIQQQIGSGGPNAQAQFQQNIQDAKGQLDELKNKINQFGGGSSDMELPQGFKPNNQKTKSFWDRVEYGTNIQSQKPNRYFPVTSDMALSIGYKLNDKSTFGIGASYKMGLGENISHINISSQGVGLRSYVDMKLKGSFWISGGYEMNYQSEFNRIGELKNLNAWQPSGLIGLSKIMSLKTKFFKKTKLMLLWDFLSYQQVPKRQPIVFRVGYQIK